VRKRQNSTLIGKSRPQRAIPRGKILAARGGSRWSAGTSNTLTPAAPPYHPPRNCERVSSAVGTGIHRALAAGEIFAGDEKRFDFLGGDAPRVAPGRNEVRFEIRAGSTARRAFALALRPSEARAPVASGRCRRIPSQIRSGCGCAIQDATAGQSGSDFCRDRHFDPLLLSPKQNSFLRNSDCHGRLSRLGQAEIERGGRHLEAIRCSAVVFEVVFAAPCP